MSTLAAFGGYAMRSTLRNRYNTGLACTLYPHWIYNRPIRNTRQDLTGDDGTVICGGVAMKRAKKNRKLEAGLQAYGESVGANTPSLVYVPM
jgi:hypothetical protein